MRSNEVGTMTTVEWKRLEKYNAKLVDGGGGGRGGAAYIHTMMLVPSSGFGCIRQDYVLEREG